METALQGKVPFAQGRGGPLTAKGLRPLPQGPCTLKSHLLSEAALTCSSKISATLPPSVSFPTCMSEDNRCVSLLVCIPSVTTGEHVPYRGRDFPMQLSVLFPYL